MEGKFIMGIFTPKYQIRCDNVDCSCDSEEIASSHQDHYCKIIDWTKENNWTIVDAAGYDLYYCPKCSKERTKDSFGQN